MHLPRRGFCLILSSPSGAGKSTLARNLLQEDRAFAMSVSVTTRPPRPGEISGVDYHFINEEQFLALRESSALLEWAVVFGNYYGTPSEPVEARLVQGLDMLFDVDWQGANAIAEKLPHDVARVFILPPSRPELERRIHGRGGDAKDSIEKRLSAADVEISHWKEYDYVLINDNVETTVRDLKAIAAAERLRRHRQVGLDRFVEKLGAQPGRR